jgi:hypothetical protein
MSRTVFFNSQQPGFMRATQVTAPVSQQDMEIQNVNLVVVSIPTIKMYPLLG